MRQEMHAENADVKTETAETIKNPDIRKWKQSGSIYTD